MFGGRLSCSEETCLAVGSKAINPVISKAKDFRIKLLLPLFYCGSQDSAYDFVARHQIGWFGAREACHIPSQEELSRFS